MKSVYNLFILIFIVLLFFLHMALKRDEAQPAGKKISRIVSLSSSLTDQVNDLGSADMLAGVTMFNPVYNGDAVIVGSYVRPDMEKIIRLRPDIVLVSDEDSIQPSLMAGRFGLRCFRSSRVFTFDDICTNYMKLATLLDKSEQGMLKVGLYRSRLAAIRKPAVAPAIVFLVSARPLITVSANSYINSIITSAGGRNVFESGTTAYPILGIESLLMSDPDAVITMNADDMDYLRRVLEQYRCVRFALKGNMFTSGDASIPYYSPARYVESVEKFASIFAEIRQ